MMTNYPIRRDEDIRPQQTVEQIRANIARRKERGDINLGYDPLANGRAQAAIDADKGLRQSLTDAFDSQHDYSSPTNREPIKIDHTTPVFRQPTVTPDEFRQGKGHERRLRGLRQTPVVQQVLRILPKR